MQVCFWVLAVCIPVFVVLAEMDVFPVVSRVVFVVFFFITAQVAHLLVRRIHRERR